MNCLALSNTGYDTFLDNDLSAFSKNILFLASDPIDKNNLTRYYLEHVKRGGTVIVVNSKIMIIRIVTSTVSLADY